jgi:hypothetical protein
MSTKPNYLRDNDNFTAYADLLEEGIVGVLPDGNGNNRNRSSITFDDKAEKTSAEAEATTETGTILSSNANNSLNLDATEQKQKTTKGRRVHFSPFQDDSRDDTVRNPPRTIGRRSTIGSSPFSALFSSQLKLFSSHRKLFSSGNFDLDNNENERTEDERAFIESVLRTNVLFQDAVRQGSLNDLASAFSRVEYKKGDVIFSQGDTDKDFMLVLEEGECSITIDGEELPEPYGSIKRGVTVGELAVLLDRDRSATVKAKTNVVAFRLDRASFKHFMAGPLSQADDIKTEIRKIDNVIDNISGVKTRYGGDIIRQYKPSRRWLWGRWHGTILQQAWTEAASNMFVSVCFVAAIRFFCQPTWAPGQMPDPSFPAISRLGGLAKLWHYLLSITTFILTFFLSQAYTMWRNMYYTARKIQGRINDIGLLVASTVERDDQGKYTKRGEALMDDVGSYTRLFHAFCWAKYSKKFQVLSTDRGMSRMLSRGLLTQKEYNSLTSPSTRNCGPHNVCVTWMLVKCLTAMKHNTLPNDRALRDVLFQKICSKILTALQRDSIGKFISSSNTQLTPFLLLLPKQTSAWSTWADK